MKENNIFDSSGCLTDKGLAMYAANTLSAQDKERAQKHITGCELCTDALEGLNQVSNITESVSDIHNRIDTLVAAKAKRNNTIKWLAAAASIVLVIGIGATWVFNTVSESKEKVIVQDLSATQKETNIAESIPHSALQAPAVITPAHSPVAKKQQKTPEKKAPQQEEIVLADAVMASSSTEETPEESQPVMKNIAAAGAKMAPPAPYTTQAAEDIAMLPPAPKTNNNAYATKSKKTIPDNLSMLNDLYAFIDNRFSESINTDRKDREADASYRTLAAKADDKPGLTFRDAYLQYQEHQYAKAIVSFDKLLLENPNDIKIKTYSVLSKMKAKRYAGITQEIAQIKTIDKFSGIYLEALYAIQTGDTISATDLLEQLIQSKNPYRTIAEEALDELKQ